MAELENIQLCAKKKKNKTNNKLTLSSGLFKDVIYKMCLEIIYLMCMYKKDLGLNNLQWWICHKTEPNQILYIQYVCIKKIWH